MLDISRLDSQRIEFNRQPVPLDDLFRRLAAEFAPVAQAKGCGCGSCPRPRSWTATRSSCAASRRTWCRTRSSTPIAAASRWVRGARGDVLAVGL
ncbi:hypothetical protein [Paracoccus marcusii]|uniref:hypothetical protein n=1 Tax=Paracoccus marcusii TaxID=59779 RepID=UPI002ED2D77E